MWLGTYYDAFFSPGIFGLLIDQWLNSGKGFSGEREGSVGKTSVSRIFICSQLPICGWQVTMDFFYLPPFKPHCLTLTVCESAYATLLGIHEIISFVPAPFPPFQVTLRDLKSISGFFFFLFLPWLLAEAFDCGGSGSERGRRLTDAAGTLRCCGEKEPVGLCCSPLSSWKERHPGVWRVGMRGRGPLSLLNLVKRVWGEGQINSIYECRALVFFNSSITALL